MHFNTKWQPTHSCMVSQLAISGVSAVGAFSSFVCHLPYIIFPSPARQKRMHAVTTGECQSFAFVCPALWCKTERSSKIFAPAAFLLRDPEHLEIYAIKAYCMFCVRGSCSAFAKRDRARSLNIYTFQFSYNQQWSASSIGLRRCFVFPPRMQYWVLCG